eukprot:gnl/Spiro4/21795_TR10686_c0_g1_i1.p2 gnl/Spiro4/21795_TR10686_c0_g1~~gnl/Spiro4/21795_TR10686_c0_g1_i1.p2  ORF type:complete len:116 (+),score=8.06 gnl/Spiro4/21795_TR10686_c0_g1_i1:41-349(+)
MTGLLSIPDAWLGMIFVGILHKVPKPLNGQFTSRTPLRVRQYTEPQFLRSLNDMFNGTYKPFGGGIDPGSFGQYLAQRTNDAAARQGALKHLSTVGTKTLMP